MSGFMTEQKLLLLTAIENGKKRGIGAMGMNVRTGKFMIFRAKTTVLTMSRPARVWLFNPDTVGLCEFRPMQVSEVDMPWGIVQVWNLP